MGVIVATWKALDLSVLLIELRRIWWQHITVEAVPVVKARENKIGTEKRQVPIGTVPARRRCSAAGCSAGTVSIEAFEVSRWCLHGGGDLFMGFQWASDGLCGHWIGELG